MLLLPIITADQTGTDHADSLNLIDHYLTQQRQLTAVEEFSHFHANGQPHEKHYRSLLPATAPGPGQQYAFEVDLDRCSGCKACVTACHALNGLDENETWRDVGLLVGGSPAAPVMQHVTAACHHCLRPACLIACPVNAYEKDPLTGIVKHLDDQCFGCQYCTLACPYDVPKYHHAKGIVRKCDMCSSRLKVGEAPACVQACPHQAISIKLVNRQQIVDDAETTAFLPAAPDPQITLPSTTYKTTRPFPRNLLPADYYRVGVQHAHWPLVVMLVLTQLSVGVFTVGMILESFLEPRLFNAIRPLQAVSALVFGLLALAASTFHLGRPRYAFRAVLGLRHSWLSREILAFGIFAGLACTYAALIFLQSPLLKLIGWSVVAVGSLAVFCSAMVYVFTQRECWSLTRVATRFTLTAALLGVAAVWWTMLLISLAHPTTELSELIRTHGPALCQAVMILAAAKLIYDAAILRHLFPRRMTPLRRSALLMVRELSSLTLARFAAGALGGLLMPAMLLGTSGRDNLKFTLVTAVLFIACLAGELLERALFFTACAAPRMPGGIR